MLAAAAAAQGHIPSQVLLLLGAIALAMFWRAALKVGLALIVIVVAVVIVKGDLALVHLFRLLIP